LSGAGNLTFLLSSPSRLSSFHRKQWEELCTYSIDFFNLHNLPLPLFDRKYAREDLGRHLSSAIQSIAGHLASCLSTPDEEAMAVIIPNSKFEAPLTGLQRPARISVEDYNA
jgi:hypothetical protein